MTTPKKMFHLQAALADPKHQFAIDAVLKTVEVFKQHPDKYSEWNIGRAYEDGTALLLYLKDGYEPLYAYRAADLVLWGCPKCGFHCPGIKRNRAAGDYVESSGSCGECHGPIHALDGGIQMSSMKIGFKRGDKEYCIPLVLVDHPRHGQAAHGKPDKTPEGGGEYFRSRGLGVDGRHGGCFVCGEGKGRYLSNIAAFAQCKAAGERVVKMFGDVGTPFLDYREYEPDWLQVKLGACSAHEPNLQKLHDLTSIDGVITDARLAEARSFAPAATPPVSGAEGGPAGADR